MDVDTEFERGRGYARRRDEADPLAGLADRFYDPDDEWYMDGNSLGLLSEDAEDALDAAVSEWKDLAIRGWTDADPPWFHYGERLGDRLAPLVGADPEEVVAANSTTVNIHTLVGTFYDRAAGTKIVVDELDFPTDHYAIRAQLRQRGVDPDAALTVVESRDGRTVAEDDVIDAIDEDTAIVFLPSALYRSGQLLDVERITEAAHAHDALAGFDLAHSVGAVPHDLSRFGTVRRPSKTLPETDSCGIPDTSQKARGLEAPAMADRDIYRLLAIGGAASLCCVGTSAVAGVAITSGAVAGGLGARGAGAGDGPDGRNARCGLEVAVGRRVPTRLIEPLRLRPAVLADGHQRVARPGALDDVGSSPLAVGTRPPQVQIAALSRRAQRQRGDPLVAAVHSALELAGTEPNEFARRYVDGAVLGLEGDGSRLDVKDLLLIAVGVIAEREAVAGFELVVVDRQIGRTQRVGQRPLLVGGSRGARLDALDADLLHVSSREATVFKSSR